MSNEEQATSSRRRFLKSIAGETAAAGATVATTMGIGGAVGANKAANDFDRAQQIWREASERTVSQTNLPKEVTSEILNAQQNNLFGISCVGGTCGPRTAEQIAQSEKIGGGFLGIIMGLGAAFPIAIPGAVGIREGECKKDSFNRRRLLEDGLLVAGSAFAGSAIGHRMGDKETNAQWRRATDATVAHYSDIETTKIYELLANHRKNLIEIAMGHPVDPGITVAEAERVHSASKGQTTGFLNGFVAGSIGVAARSAGNIIGERRINAETKKAGSTPVSPSR